MPSAGNVSLKLRRNSGGKSRSCETAISSFFLAVLLSFCGLAAEVPVFSGRVVDRTGLFTPAELERIEDVIRQLESRINGQMAVLVIPTLDGEPIEEFGVRVVDRWKADHRRSENRAILIVALNDRQVRLEVGPGWENEINDMRAGNITRELSLFIRNGDCAAGIVNAVTAAAAFAINKRLAAPPPDRWSDWLIGAGVIILTVLLSLQIRYGIH